MLRWFFKKMVDGLCLYGKWGAGMPSCHGSFEASVPDELIFERTMRCVSAHRKD